MPQPVGAVLRHPFKHARNDRQEPQYDQLIAHLQAEHHWVVDFRGWRHEDLVLLHDAEHDEAEPPTAA